MHGRIDKINVKMVLKTKVFVSLTIIEPNITRRLTT